LGLSHTFSGVYKFFKKPLPTELISWDDVELLAGDQGILLKTSPKKLAELYPADLADILMDMNQLQGGKFIEHLDVSQIADALENVETDYQTRLLESMDNEKVADVLEEMAPDDAADLLAELPEERSAALLKLMEGDEAEDVRKLLKYEDDTAGGLMTTDYVTAPLTATAEEVICQLREIGEEIETLYYVYVTDTDNVLTGIFSLSDLILALPQTPVSEFMRKRVTSVLLEDSQDEVARIVAKYNLLAVPVVDEGDHLHGIVTSDDALDKIIPTSWKKRLPRYY
jgi:Mg2+ transporter MgtE